VEAKHDFGFRWFFDPEALRADRYAAIATDPDGGAHAPHIIPPRAAGCRPQDGAFFFLGLIPRPLRSLAQFAMDFMGVAMRPQVVDMQIGDFDFGDLFAGEVGGQTPLPELMFAFDFALGLRRGGIAETDVIELERPTQLGEGVGIVREKDTVVIDVDLERASVGQERGGQEVEVGEQQFALIKLRAGEQTAAIIEHVEHGEEQLGVRKPTVRRGGELPEFADLSALPAAHGGPNFFWRDGMGELVSEGPAADLGAVEFEGVQAERASEAAKLYGHGGEQAKRFLSRSVTGCGHAAA